MQTKINTIRNSYKEAQFIASSDQLAQSMKLVDQLYLNNGYVNPRQYIKPSNPHQFTGTFSSFKRQNLKHHILKLPFISDEFSRKVDKYISQHKLPFRIVYLKPVTLANMFCRSRPLDKTVCSRGVCKICTRLSGNHTCKVKGVVYRIVCNLCGGDYIGETGRTAYERLSEHYNYMNNPTAKSYKELTLAKHYNTLHNQCEPDLTFEILAVEGNTLKRKIREAYYIRNRAPTLNEKFELEYIKKYMI